jgi:hypothetical protein
VPEYSNQAPQMVRLPAEREGGNLGSWQELFRSPDQAADAPCDSWKLQQGQDAPQPAGERSTEFVRKVGSACTGTMGQQILAKETFTPDAKFSTTVLP